jgi:hypothetical protein
MGVGITGDSIDDANVIGDARGDDVPPTAASRLC